MNTYETVCHLLSEFREKYGKLHELLKDIQEFVENHHGKFPEKMWIRDDIWEQIVKEFSDSCGYQVDLTTIKSFYGILIEVFKKGENNRASITEWRLEAIIDDKNIYHDRIILKKWDLFYSGLCHLNDL